MRKQDDAAKPDVSGAELKALHAKAAKGEVINYGDQRIASMNDFRRAFAAHPELAALEGRDGTEDTADAEEARDREREAILARVVELEGYLDANQKTFEANQASIEALQEERDKALTAADNASKYADEKLAERQEAIKIGKEAVARAEKAEQRVAELEKELADLKAAQEKPSTAKSEKTSDTATPASQSK